jgi:hypothetical protein
MEDHVTALKACLESQSRQPMQMVRIQASQ